MGTEEWTKWGSIFTCFSAIATFVMAYLTWKYVKATSAMVQEMVTTREATFRPYVVANLEIENAKSIYFVVQNTGQTTAKNVQVKFEHDLKNMANQSISGLSFNNPIATIIPGWKFMTYINESELITKENDYVVVQNVKVEYQSPNGECYSDSFELNFSLIRSRRWVVSSSSRS